MSAWKKLISALLTLVLLLSVLPAALAEEAVGPVLPAEDRLTEAEAASGSRSGWYKAGSNWYYYRNGTLVRNDWVKDGGKWYYFKSTGVMCAKEQMLMDNYVDYYMFGADGAMLTNRWVQTDSSWYAGSVFSSYRSRMGSDWYYCGSDGRLYNDRWLKYGGYWYLFYGNGSMIRDEVYGDTGKYYYFDSNGHMVTSRWVRRESGWLYAGGDGVLYRNRWLSQNGKWYYFDDYRYMVAGGVYTVGGRRYLFSASGAMAGGSWVQDSAGDWYYANSDGIALTGKWLKYGGSWYYFGSDSRMLRSVTQTINGKRYSFNASGVCLNP